MGDLANPGSIQPIQGSVGISKQLVIEGLEYRGCTLDLMLDRIAGYFMLERVEFNESRDQVRDMIKFLEKMGNLDSSPKDQAMARLLEKFLLAADRRMGGSME